MSTPTQQPEPYPVPPAPRPGATRVTGATVLGGGAAISALTFVGAPWWVVTIATLLAIVTPGTILLVQAVVPQDSEHKRDLWLALIRFLERRRRTSRNRR
ncbi:hypothetical protein DCW30_24985 [Streptomyces alfalfae]|uniref:Uncharacterized protein n=1 Tax=Streptomyces alfalfae TaxID=1642299 RepID=A0ABN4VDT0_9ACTN|nr:hypothetical protein [Streptomyces alfalfae]APY85496.1 hypothetical protein A7J05_06995 [Streptomyces alfalfae]AYA15852.1 hypothetical protein D3X13_06050 [Streptomyces fradiae]RXX39328.1 hypothetical protein DCW30_24985 [Streptomyces alfalfae]RZM96243.1 hypothetical protein D4104_15490 [Streptomyces alfalfae]